MNPAPKLDSTPLPNFAAFEPYLESKSPWLSELKKKAFVRYHEVGFPTSRLEEWKYTNIVPLTRLAFGPGKVDQHQDALEAFLLDPWEGARLVFVNGHFAPALSQLKQLPAGVVLKTFSQGAIDEMPAFRRSFSQLASPEEQFFTAVNTAFFQDGVCLLVPQNTVVKSPIQILHVSFGEENARIPMSHPRNWILLQEGSSACLVEEYLGRGQGSYCNNAVTEIILEKSAALKHCVVQKENRDATHISFTRAVQLEHSTYESHVFCLEGAQLRNDLRVVLSGENSQCHLNGLCVTKEKDQADNYTVIEHAAPHCQSVECYKQIVDGNAIASFNGRILVRPHAQKTKAEQINRNLLLSENATANSKPQLEIYANDVICSHGSATGSLDSDSIFYFRSRGIAEEVARQMLTQAFAEEMVAKIPVEVTRRQVSEWLTFSQEQEGP